MTTKKDVLIIGGGMVGVCAATYLQQAGLKTAIVEKGSIASGCSEGNAGLIVPSHVTPLAAPGVISQGFKWMFNPSSPFYIKPRLSTDLFAWIWKFTRFCNEAHVARCMPILHELIQASLKQFKELEAQYQLDSHLTQDGLLMLFRTERGRHGCVEEVKPAQKMGMEARILDKDALYDLEPHCPTDMLGGVYYPQDAHLDPGRFVFGLEKKLREGGTEIHTHTEVLGFQKQGRRLSAVRTNKGDFKADQIILAGGAWSPGIVRELSLKLPVQPAKGYSLTLENPVKQPRIPMILMEDRATVTPMANRMRFAGTLELAGLDLSINKRRVRSVLKAVPEYFPNFDPETLDWNRVWAGFRPCSPDGLPYLGRSKSFNNLVVAAGHAMIGVTLGPITGKIVADLVQGKNPGTPLEALEVERFT